jgi:endonuclease/exonuclease/phosphatase family metal-dependent hydrolase
MATRAMTTATTLTAIVGLAACACLASDHSEPWPTAPARGAVQAAADKAKLLRVMTFNLRTGTAADGENRWDNRKALLAETIKTFNPDLLGIQEALKFQNDYLQDQLEGYILEGVARDDGRQKGEYSAILYRKARFERLDGGNFWLSPTPDKPSLGWDAACIRIVAWVKLRDRVTRQSFAYFNTHWDHIGKVARVESAKLMRRRIEALDEATPVLVTGDLNSREEEEQVNALLGSASGVRLFNAYRQTHPTKAPDEATFHNFSGKAAGGAIDYILCTAPFAVREAAIDRTSREGRYPSDHFPVTAILELKSRPERR